jgi:hypothetical protein
MRTTINLDEQLLKLLKEKAHQENLGLGEIISKAIKNFLFPANKNRKGFQWQTFKGKAQPTVPIHNRSAIYDLMED